MNNNINFTDDIQEWLRVSKENKQNQTMTHESYDSFGNKWNQIGEVLRSTLTNQQYDTITSFNAMTLNDFIKILPNATPDNQNFWVSSFLPNFKFTTFSFLGGEEGFYKYTTSSTQITFVAFETYDIVQPKLIEYEQCKLILMPYVQSPISLLFFFQHFQYNNNQQQSPQPITIQTQTLTTSTSSLPQPSSTTTYSTTMLDVNVETLLERWKIEKPNMKPTIPKLSDFANVEQEKIHKWLKNNGRSWSNMLVTYGFR